MKNNKTQSGLEKIVIIVLTVIIALAAIVGASYAFKKFTKIEQLIGGKKDEHGCMLMAGYTWCEAEQKCLREWEEPCEQEEVFNLLTELKDSTKIKFSGIHDAELEWIVGVDPKIAEETVAGKGFDVERISSEQYNSLYPFFIDNGFATDIYNFTAGAISELIGYSKGKAVCTVAGGLTGYREAEDQWIPPETDKWDVIIKCGELKKTKMEYATENWQVYENEKHGYSLKYPAPCLFGPLPDSCKQSPPEERPQECRCYFNAENPDEVSLGTFTGTKSDLTGVSFAISYYSTEPYNPPADTDFISWLKEKFSYQDIPDEINMEIDGISAVKVYTPFSGMAWSQEDIYFIRNDKLLKISMLDVDNENNRALYDKILFSFKLNK